MAKILSTIINWHYVVTAPEECRIEDSSGLLLGIAAPGSPVEFEASGLPVSLSSDRATMLESHCRTETIYGLQPCMSYVPGELTPGVVYDAGTLLSDTDWSKLKFQCATSMVQTCEIWFKTREEVPAVVWPDSAIWLNGFGGAAPDFEANMAYRLVLRAEYGDKLIISLAYAYSV